MYDDALVENARILKNYIDELKDSIKNIYGNIKTLNQNYDYLKGDSESFLSKDFIHRIH